MGPGCLTKHIEQGRHLTCHTRGEYNLQKRTEEEKEAPPDWWDVKLGFQTVLFKLASHHICYCEFSHILLFYKMRLKKEMDRTGFSLILLTS